MSFKVRIIMNNNEIINNDIAIITVQATSSAASENDLDIKNNATITVKIKSEDSKKDSNEEYYYLLGIFSTLIIVIIIIFLLFTFVKKRKIQKSLSKDSTIQKPTPFSEPVQPGTLLFQQPMQMQQPYSYPVPGTQQPMALPPTQSQLPIQSTIPNQQYTQMPPSGQMVTPINSTSNAPFNYYDQSQQVTEITENIQPTTTQNTESYQQIPSEQQIEFSEQHNTPVQENEQNYDINRSTTIEPKSNDSSPEQLQSEQLIENGSKDIQEKESKSIPD
jgi:hypothetical protein